MATSSARRLLGIGTVLAPAVAASITLASVFTRSIGVPKANTLWAEDGQVFLTCLSRGDTPWWCVVEVHGGYLHVVPRIAANLAWLAPPDLWAMSIAAVAAVILAVTAWLVGAAIVDATGSVLAAVAGGAALALVFQAGREVGGNLANVHWILFSGAVVLIALTLLGRELSRRDLVFIALTGLSSPLAPVLAVLAGLGWLARRPVRAGVVSATVGASIVQVGAFLRFPRNPPLYEPLGLTEVLGAYGDRILAAGPFGALPWPAGPAVAAATLAVGVALAVAWVGARTAVDATSVRRRAGGALAAMTVMLGSGFAAYAASLVANLSLAPRYEYVPSVLMVEALVLGAALVTARSRTDAPAAAPGHSRLARSGPVAIVIAILAVGAVASYRVEARTSGGPAYDGEFDTATSACAAGAASVHVRTGPRAPDRVWTVEVPCDRLATVWLRSPDR
ncbi:MAG: hypothetical protein L0227_03680 [Chloroflexi bacterium]|nr:hypothetical protein [Chloroflexota bacterium]